MLSVSILADPTNTYYDFKVHSTWVKGIDKKLGDKHMEANIPHTARKLRPRQQEIAMLYAKSQQADHLRIKHS